MSIKHHMLELFKNSTDKPLEQNNDITGDDDESGGGGKKHGMLGLFDANKMANLVSRGVFKAQSLPALFSTQLEPSSESHIENSGVEQAKTSSSSKSSEASRATKSNSTFATSSASGQQRGVTTSSGATQGLQSSFGYDVTLANSQAALGCTVAGSNLGRHHGNSNGAVIQTRVAGSGDSSSYSNNSSGVSKLFQGNAVTQTNSAANTADASVNLTNPGSKFR